MLQLAYISSSRTPVDQPLLESILTASRRNNSRCGVTGLLVSGGRRFLQVLEGPDQAVLTTYARIQADPRHMGLVMLSSRHVPARAFGSWSMAHQLGGDGSGDIAQVVAALTAGMEDANLRAQFTGFAQLHKAA